MTRTYQVPTVGHPVPLEKRDQLRAMLNGPCGAAVQEFWVLLVCMRPERAVIDYEKMQVTETLGEEYPHAG